MATTMVLKADPVDAEAGVHTSIAFSRLPQHQPDDCANEGLCHSPVVPALGQSFSWARQSPTKSRESRMPASGGPGPLLASLPSFTPVFGSGENVQEVRELEGATAGARNKAVNIHKRLPSNSHYSSPILRRDSASTFESTDSSPTTTISTMDSALTEPSPSSSPESPASVAPLPTFGPSYGTSKAPGSHAVGQAERPSTAFASLPGVNRADSPNKKMRNMKNLSVNTSTLSRGSQHLPQLAFQPNTLTTAKAHAFSAPPTPSFIVPPKLPRKNPSNLGLKISTPDDNSISKEGSNIVPPTPSIDSQTRTLNYLQSVSAAPLICSPTVAPEGGMRLPPLGGLSNGERTGKTRPPLSMSYRSWEYQNSSPISRQTLDHVEEENDYELPLSREAKSPAYPQGPVCVYDPHVYLYLEPTDTEASQFDVVLNVAREVKNPFTAAMEKTASSRGVDAAVQVELGDGEIYGAHQENVPAPSDKSFSSALDTKPDFTPQTIPDVSSGRDGNPEYIHILWDHNTNVVDDLLRLCELIDDRTKKGMKVLVHCQCGVSRSASLVVAYGLYKNPNLTVQEAYDAVKSRSRWIGPNMNLIYQLSEFKSKLPKTMTAGQASWHSWRDAGRSNPNSKTPDVRSALPSSSFNEPPLGHVSALFRKDLDLTPARANSFSPPGSAQITGKKETGDITPGPSSAPPDMQWSPSGTQMLSPTFADKNPFDRLPSDQVNAPAQGEDPSRAPVSMEIGTSVYPSPSFFSTQLTKSTKLPRLALRKDEQKADEQPLTAAPSPLAESLPAGFSSMTTRRGATPRQLPFRQEPPRFTSSQISTSFRNDHPVIDEPPLTPSLLSPRAAEFTASPFHRTAAGDLAGSSIAEQAVMSPKPQDDDPRSPAERGQAPIVRSIFDML